MALIPLDERKIAPTHLQQVASAYPSQQPRLGWPVSEMVADIEADARAAGFKAPQFRVISGYRDVATQERLWRQALAKAGGDVALARKTTAPPGNSSHFSGFAFDIFLGRGSTDMALAPSIFRSREYKFMRDTIAPKYNLTQLSNEPWHWECDKACRDAYLTSKYGVVLTEPSNLDFTVALQDEGAGEEGAATSKAGRYLLIGAVGVALCAGAWYLTTRSRSNSSV